MKKHYRRSLSEYTWPILVLAALAVTVFAFLPALDAGFVNWDDTLYVTGNNRFHYPLADSLRYLIGSVYLGNYQPLTLVSLWIDHLVAGDNPRYYHAVNLGLHAANVVLAYYLATVITKDRAIALLGALVWAIHPLRVESVVWVSSRKDMLYTLFLLVAALLYLHARNTGSRRAAATAVLCAIASGLSKSMAMVIGPLLLVLEFARGARIERRTITACAPFFVISILTGGLAVWAAGQESMIDVRHDTTIAGTLLTAAYGIVFYLAKTLVPIELSAYYPVLPFSQLSWTYVATCAAAPLLGILLFFLRNNRSFVSAAAWYLCAIAPTLRLVPVGGTVVAERYSYVATLGPCILLSGVLVWAFRRTELRAIRLGTGSLIALALVTLAGLATATWQRSGVWHDSLTLWNDTIAKQPLAAAAYSNRGTLHQQEGRADLALADFERAVAVDPRYGDWHYNRGRMFQQLGRFDEAFSDYSQAIALDPRAAASFVNRSQLLLMKGDAPAALADVRHALAIFPRYPLAWFNLALIYDALQTPQAAFEAYDQTLALNPRMAEAYNNRANAALKLGRSDDALADYSRALMARPNFFDALYNRARLNLLKGRINEAAIDARAALESNPQSRPAAELIYHIQQRLGEGQPQ